MVSSLRAILLLSRSINIPPALAAMCPPEEPPAATILAGSRPNSLACDRISSVADLASAMPRTAWCCDAARRDIGQTIEPFRGAKCFACGTNCSTVPRSTRTEENTMQQVGATFASPAANTCKLSRAVDRFVDVCGCAFDRHRLRSNRLLGFKREATNHTASSTIRKTQ